MYVHTYVKILRTNTRNGLDFNTNIENQVPLCSKYLFRSLPKAKALFRSR